MLRVCQTTQWTNTSYFIPPIKLSCCALSDEIKEDIQQT